MKKNEFLKYFIENRQFHDTFTIFETVNDLTIINQSRTNNLIVNNVVLVPGQQFNTGGNYGEYIDQQFNCSFSSEDTVNNSALVLLKRYPILQTQNIV